MCNKHKQPQGWRKAESAQLTTVQVAADTSGPVTITAEEARAALEDMPIDAEYTEK